MSSFNCEHCNALCADTEFGYVTGCEHYPAEPKALRKYMKLHLLGLYGTAQNLAQVAAKNQHFLAKPLVRLCEELITSLTILG